MENVYRRMTVKISIITITFNSEKTLEETISSVATQNVDGITLEYIIIDGKSTDGTIEIIKRYNDKITRWISEPDQGISDAFNKGIQMATGEIIGIINSDDLLLPDALQVLRENYDQNVDIYFGNGKRLHSNGDFKLYKANPDLRLLERGMFLVHPAVFVKKTAYEKYGLFDIKLKCVMDRELLLRMYKAGAKFKYIDKELIIYRDGGVSNKQYFARVLPEEEKISIQYGMPFFTAKRIRWKNWWYMHLVFIVKRLKGQM